jgi:hypothetical protein
MAFGTYTAGLYANENRPDEEDIDI